MWKLEQRLLPPSPRTAPLSKSKRIHLVLVALPGCDTSLTREGQPLAHPLGGVAGL